MGTEPLVSDKDGVFCLLPRQWMQQELEFLLDSQHCTEISELSFNPQTIMREYSGTAKAIGERGGRALHAKLMKIGPIEKLPANMFWNVKTDKKPGAVSFRKVHANAGFPLAPMGRWLSLILRDKLDGHPFVCKDTMSFLKDISKIELHGDEILVKFDIGEFFMTGDHPELARAAASFAKDGWQDLAERAALTLLDNQLVHITDTQHRRRLYKVNTGAGQGLNYAGDLANAAYARTVEEPLFQQPPYILEDFYGIVLWRRVFDDIFVVMRAAEYRARTLLAFIKRLSPLWKYDGLEISPISFTSVDVDQFSKNGRTNASANLIC